MDPLAFLRSLAYLFWDIVLPILVMAAAGFAAQRRFKLDLASISKLQLNIFVPAFMCVRVSESSLTWADIGLVVGAMLAAETALALPVWWVVRRRGIAPGSAAVLVLASVVFNSGNFGIPLAERAYPGYGGSVQALVLMTSNLTIWALGYMLLSAAAVGRRGAVMGFLKTPLFFSLVMALLLKGTRWPLPTPIKYPLETLAAGLVPLALLMLGAQLSMRVRAPHWRRVLPVMGLKLVGLPLVMAVVVRLLGLWPWPGAMLIVAASAPTAVNSFLLALELKGDSELAAECVFWTTLFSALTVTTTLAIVKGLGGGPPG
jgi:predicted permease